MSRLLWLLQDYVEGRICYWLTEQDCTSKGSTSERAVALQLAWWRLLYVLLHGGREDLL